MTLAGSFRPGAPTIPQPLDIAKAAERAHLQFLSAEERATAQLMGFYTDARLELEDFIRTGDLTVSDATYYRRLLDETNRIGSRVNTQGAQWTSSVIPDAYSAGWRQNSSVVVPQRALEALSRETLGLIRETTEGIRATVRSAIASGILEGLPADAIRQRILASGLTNIPHWPSVEYRAGVIARTETMRAYNAGNVASIEESGARFVEWIASPDEATCRICLPRDGEVYRLSDDVGGNDPYPSAQLLPRLPAHPRCRCTVRARFRGPDGEVIRADVPEIPPKLPKDAMGGDAPARLPPAVGDFERALKRLSEAQSTMDIDDVVAMKKFWQGVELDRQKIFALANIDDRSYRNLFDYRYGISVHGLGMTSVTARERQWLLEALEQFETVGFRWRDSPWLREWHFDTSLPGGAPNPAHYDSTFQRIVMVPSRYPTDATPYRIGDLPYMQSSMLHELGHALDAHLFGVLTRDFDRSPFVAIHNATGGAASVKRIESELKGVRELRALSVDRIIELERLIERAAGADELRSISKRLADHQELLARYDQAISKLEKMLKAAPAGSGIHPTDYAKENQFEDFADTFLMYLLDPDELKRISPARYKFFADRMPRA